MTGLPPRAEIARMVKNRLGSDATPMMVESIVDRVLQYWQKDAPPHGDVLEPSPKNLSVSSGRIIVVAYGIDRPGVVAALSRVASQAGVDILDISQKRLQEWFVILMIIEISTGTDTFESLSRSLTDLAGDIGIRIHTQTVDSFRTADQH